MTIELDSALSLIRSDGEASKAGEIELAPMGCSMLICGFEVEDIFDRGYVLLFRPGYIAT